MIIDVWRDVLRELDLWSGRGLRAKFWVRDDDACEMTTQLARLYDFARRHNVNIGLAVIPGKIKPDFVKTLADMRTGFHPMCHGWKHINYGSTDEPEEFGSARRLKLLIDDAESAFKVFVEYFGDDGVTFVPPFGRITRALIKALPNIGFSAVSLTSATGIESAILRLESRLPWVPIARLPSGSPIPRVDARIDLIDWRKKTARDARLVAMDLINNLRLRRKGFIPFALPVGILSHHLVHDEMVWNLFEDVLGLLQCHEAFDLVSAANLMTAIQRRPPSARRPLGIVRDASPSHGKSPVS